MSTCDSRGAVSLHDGGAASVGRFGMKYELRPWRVGDEADFFRFGCAPGVTRWMTAGFPRTLDECARTVAGSVREEGAGQWCRAVVIGGRAVGCVAAFRLADGTAKVAYWLGEAFQRRGVMTEVLGRFCRTLWAETDLTALTAAPLAGNEASRRTLMRVGFYPAEDGIYRMERPQEQ